ncbi:MAG TPA: SRPBCC family protein [Solirubrobacteraceae bacterium]|nr:SRPBCC family protein [Solirubrobacteraceae bacterium]
MKPVTVSIDIDRPREELFGYLADVANHPEFCDHFLTDWRLTREDSYGTGAGARFKGTRRLTRYGWADMWLVVVDPPREMVAHGRGGMFNRIPSVTVWSLESNTNGGTHVEVTTETAPATATDRLSEALGQRAWATRGWRKALRRLRAIAEEDRQRGRRATIAGGPRKPASAFHFDGHV